MFTSNHPCSVDAIRYLIKYFFDVSRAISNNGLFISLNGIEGIIKSGEKENGLRIILDSDVMGIAKLLPLKMVPKCMKGHHS